MTTQEQVWLSSYNAAIAAGESCQDAIFIADTAIKAFEARFPQ